MHTGPGQLHFPIFCLFLVVVVVFCFVFVLFVCLFLLPEVAVTLEVARLPWTHAYGPWTAPLSHFFVCFLLLLLFVFCFVFVLFVCLFLLPEVAVTLEVARLPWTHAYGPWTAPLSHFFVCFLLLLFVFCFVFVLFVCLFLLPEVAVTLEVARLPWTHAYGPWTPRPK